MRHRIAWPHHWLLVAGSLAVFSTIALASDVKKDERIVFFPTFAHLSEDGRTWTTRVHGWIFEPESDGVLRNAAIASFRNALGLSADEAESRVFEQRAQAFLADNERGKRIAIQIGEVTEVTNRKRLLWNTFLLLFRAVDGMADIYRRWSNGGARFHFVSASPWQLYEPLAEFANQTGFPAATFHLRQVRFKDSSVLSLLADPLEAKLRMIEPLMAAFPHRRFILVGDSGERDPEVYGRIAEKHPDRVLRIYIRDVTGHAAQSPRYQAAFGKLPPDKWQLFREPVTIED